MVCCIKFPLRIVVMDEDLEFDGVLLSDEKGYWTRDTIFVWKLGYGSLEKFGIFVHEFVEWLLEGVIGIPHSFSHFVSCVVEKVVTFGRCVKV